MGAAKADLLTGPRHLSPFPEPNIVIAAVSHDPIGVTSSLQIAMTLLGETINALPTLLLLYWSLASFASTVALLPIPGVSGFR